MSPVAAPWSAAATVPGRCRRGVVLAAALGGWSVGLGIAAASGQISVPAPQPGAMVTVEGCVSKDDRATASSAAAQFVLTESAAPAPAAAPSPSSSPGASAAGPPIRARAMYVLRAQVATIDLPQYVGRRVRATGATTAPQTTSPLAGRSPAATPHPSPTGPPGSTGTLFDTANLPTLAVTALVRLEGSCR